ncbi:MAG: hypothetical protein WEB88_00110 [Gemmatimonadota bacterium]
MRPRHLGMILPFALALTACGDFGLGLDGRNVEGNYALDGAVYGEPHHSVAGFLRLDERRRGDLDAYLDWNYREGAYTVVEIETEYPARVDTNGYDRLTFDFEGQLWTGSRYVSFLLQHEGRVDRRVIRGTWRFRTGHGIDERGEFVARR